MEEAIFVDARLCAGPNPRAVRIHGHHVEVLQDGRDASLPSPHRAPPPPPSPDPALSVLRRFVGTWVLEREEGRTQLAGAVRLGRGIDALVWAASRFPRLPPHAMYVEGGQLKHTFSIAAWSHTIVFARGETSGTFAGLRYVTQVWWDGSVACSQSLVQSPCGGSFHSRRFVHNDGRLHIENVYRDHRTPCGAWCRRVYSKAGE